MRTKDETSIFFWFSIFSINMIIAPAYVDDVMPLVIFLGILGFALFRIVKEIMKIRAYQKHVPGLTFFEVLEFLDEIRGWRLIREASQQTRERIELQEREEEDYIRKRERFLKALASRITPL